MTYLERERMRERMTWDRDKDRDKRLIDLPREGEGIPIEHQIHHTRVVAVLLKSTNDR